MQVFVDDESGYRQWKERNPRGFILNTARKPGPDYLILHRPTCPHLNRGGATVHWTKHFIKVCSLQVEEIEAWVKATVPGTPRITRCMFCHRN
ncbi:MAG: hypothetical protein ACRDJH_20410 [Thermomicrobiales bacterium]